MTDSIVAMQSPGHDAISSPSSQIASLLHVTEDEDELLEDVKQSDGQDAESSPASQIESLLQEGIDEELLEEELPQSIAQLVASSGSSHMRSPHTAIFFLQIANE